jgi:hypothetical protein
MTRDMRKKGTDRGRKWILGMNKEHLHSELIEQDVFLVYMGAGNRNILI